MADYAALIRYTGWAMTANDKDVDYSLRSTNMADISRTIFRQVFEEPGRHNVRIFSMPPEQIALGLVGTALVGFPLIFFIGIVPIWDLIGNLPGLRQFHNFVAPVLVGLPDGHLPEYPLKRMIIAVVFMIECYLLGNLIALGFRRVRRRALLVWNCYGHEKLLLYFFISGVAFVAAWCFFFYDWRVLKWLSSGRQSGKVAIWLAVSLPISTAIFGHLVAIVAIGAIRDMYRKVRKLRAIRRSSLHRV